MINACIVEDEAHCLSAIKNALALHADTINVIGETGSVSSAATMIAQKKPDVVFLDVYLPDGTAFDIIEKVGQVDTKIIFTTAHDQFALKAIKYSALDYLLKPIDPGELDLAIEKIERETYKSHQLEKVENLLAGLQKKANRLVLHTHEGIELVDVDSIIWLEAENSYTRIHMADRSSLLFSKNLKYFEELLESDLFFRVHHSAIIHMNFIRKYLKEDGGLALMQDGSKVPIASRRRMEFLERLAQGS